MLDTKYYITTPFDAEACKRVGGVKTTHVRVPKYYIKKSYSYFAKLEKFCPTLSYPR